MPTVAKTNLPTILQAVEQRLLSFTSALTTSPVVGDLSNIYWVRSGEEPRPGATGQRDILFAMHRDQLINVQGDGRFAKILSGFDVYLRSTLVADKLGTKRDWFIAHRRMIDSLMDALTGFFPEDGDGNALTIEGLVLDTNATPVKNRDAATWGETIGTYRFHYQPNVDTTLLG